MIKAFVLIHRRSDLDWNEFSRYFRDVHGPLALRLPGLRHYEQHHVREAFFGGDAPCDAIAELWFDNADALRSAFDSDAGRTALADNPNFADVSRTRLVVGC
jgi:uncharacterized protein (TIGR02118 family)